MRGDSPVSFERVGLDQVPCTVPKIVSPKLLHQQDAVRSQHAPDFAYAAAAAILIEGAHHVTRRNGASGAVTKRQAARIGHRIGRSYALAGQAQGLRGKIHSHGVVSTGFQSGDEFSVAATQLQDPLAWRDEGQERRRVADPPPQGATHGVLPLPRVAKAMPAPGHGIKARPVPLKSEASLGARMTSTPVVDFRSDTITQPTDAMRDAMRNAVVGDDVFGDDPTVNELQAVAAERVGMEAALFVPSGTMGNEVAVYVHSGRKGEILVEERSHIFLYEGAGPAQLSGVQVRTIPGRRGVFGPDDVLPLVRDQDDPHEPPTTMVALENTHNIAGGTVWTRGQTQDVARFVAERSIPLHVDGARLFNSAVAQGVSAASLVDGAQSVMFCLSKGLSAPVGSMLCGPQRFIDEAWRVRKLFGGGMRQVGVLAAAGLVALDEMVDRLREDHAHAQRLAAGLSKIEGIRVDPSLVQTNIVFAEVTGAGIGAKALEGTLAQNGVLSIALNDQSLRFVTHRHITREGVDQAVRVVASAVGALVAAQR